MSKKGSLKKFLSVIVAVLIIMSSLPISSVYAATNVKLGIVSVLTESTSAEIQNNNQENVIVEYNNTVKLDWSPKDITIGRNSDGWWAGIKISAPEGFTVNELKSSSYKTLYNGYTEWSSNKSFWNAQDSDINSDDEEIERYITMWAFVNENVLNEAIRYSKTITNKYQFDWDNDSIYEQSIEFNIDPNNIELFKEVDGIKQQVYPNESLGTVSAITSSENMVVTGSNTNIATVENQQEITLVWSQANTAIGRNSDGWWAGIKISAPENLTVNELKSSSYKTLYYGYTEWSNGKNFWNAQDSNKNSDDEGIERYITMWAFVDESVISSAKENSKTIENKYQFDWNNDGVYEQSVVFSLNPSKLSLDYTNLYAMDTAAPEFSDTTEDAVVWVNDKVDITGKAIDKGTENNGTTYTSGTEKVEYAKGSETASRTAADFDENTNEFSFSVTDEFLGDYYIFATDKANNEAKCRVYVQLDNKKPTLSDVKADVTEWTNNGVKITGNATDTLSGVDKIVYKIGDSGVEQETSVTTTDEGKNASFELILAPQSFAGTVYVTAVDKSGLKSETKEISVKMDNEKCIVINADPSSNQWNNDDITISGSFSDNLSGVKEVKYCKDGESTENNAIIQSEDNGKTGTFSFTINKQDYNGNYLVYCIDNATNDSKPKTVVSVKMDISAPSIDDNSAKANPSSWTKENITISGTFNDNLSGIEKIEYRKDIDGASFEVLDESNITFDDEDTRKTGSYSFEIEKQNYDGNYIVRFNDRAGNYSDATVAVLMDTNSAEVKVSTDIALAYKLLNSITFGIFKAPVTVTVSASDEFSGVKSISYETKTLDGVGKENQGSISGNIDYAENNNDVEYKFTIPAEYQNGVEVTVIDYASNEKVVSEINDSNNGIYNGIIVDVTDPAIDEIDYNTTIFRDNKYYYSGDVVVDFAVNEEYFFAEYMDSAKIDIKAIDSAVTVNVTKNGEDYTNFEKVLDEASKTISVKIPSLNNDGDYVIDLTYADPAGNTVNVKTDTLVIDTTAPVITVGYDNNTPNNEKYFNTDRVATITVVEHNFVAEDFIAKFEAKDIKGNDVAVEDYAAKLKDYSEWNHDGDIHTIDLKFSVDANYKYSFIGYKDATENDNEYSFAEGSVATNDFVIDHINPSDVVITYSDSVLEKLLGTVTFGFYKSKCEVTLTTTDATSPIDYFSYSYDVNDPVNTGNVGGSNLKAVAVVDVDDASKFTTKFEIPAQFRGQVTATATDKATNKSNSVTDAKTIVTDTISPVMSVSYSFADNAKNGVDYYNKDVTVTLNVTDENFMDGEYPSEVNDIVISANIEDENKLVTTETYSVTNWTRVNNTDEWQGTFTLSTEGDYTLSISYTDKSGNAMAAYSRDKLTIDKTKPVITAEYNTPIQKVSNSDKEVSYYNDTVGMKLTVVEHNFDASYFASGITATDVNKNIISEANEAIQKFIENDSNWSSGLDGNTHTIIVPIEDVEANYSIDYKLCDLAINYADEPIIKKLTFDTTNPEIELSIKSTVVRKLLNGISFGIFDKQVDSEVTITATDCTSGIEKIEYYTYETQGAIGNIENTKVDVSNIIVTDNVATTKGVTIEQNDGKQVVTFKFTVKPEFRNRIKATVYDYSTNSSTIDNVKNYEDGLIYNGIVKDVEEPKIELSVDENAVYASKDTFAGDFNFYVDITDTNAGISGIEVDINGKKISKDNKGNVIADVYAGDDTKDNLIENAKFAVNSSQADKASDGVYVLTVKATDNSNNTISKSYTAYIDVWSPMVTDFSFESTGRAYTGDDAYVYGEKVQVVDKDSETYNYYFEKTTKVTVYVFDLSNNTQYNQHTSGVKEIKLIAEDKEGNIVKCSPVEGSFIQTTNDAIGYSQITYLVEGPFKGNLYAMATDYAGNYPTLKEENGLVAPPYKSLISNKYDGYVNPYDTIIESIEKHSSTSSISITPKINTEKTQTYAYQYKYSGKSLIRDEQSKIDYIDSQNVPLYNSNVEFELKVEDMYSGIKQVKWSVVGQKDQDSQNDQSGVVTINNLGEIVNPENSGWNIDASKKSSNLVTSMSRTITVTNDSNDIVILVELTDRAENTSYDYYVLGIDKTPAKVTVELDKKATNGKYFNESRKATIVVEERNFDASSFDLSIFKNNDSTPSVNGSKLKWTHQTSDIDAVNSTTHIAEYTISEEGDYKISASNVDFAGNGTSNEESVKPSYKGFAPTNFIIDKKKPSIKVSMTGTSQNEKFYFNEDRTVKIVVTDRNFNAKDVDLKITSNGSTYSQKLNWKQDQTGYSRTNATKNVAEFTFSSEADYTFDISCVDKANNESVSVKYATDDCQKFTIDKTAPKVEISQTVFESANNGKDDDGNVINIPLKVTVKDTNIGNLYNENKVTSKEVSEILKVSMLKSNAQDASFKQTDASRDTVVYSVSNILNDGIYTLDLNIQDCAGNKMDAVVYNSTKDKTSVKTVTNGTTDFFKFSVNRNGSVFTIDEKTSELVNTYYVKNVQNDVRIIETNVDELSGDNLVSNVKVVKDGQVDNSALSFVKVDKVNTSSLWQRYVYTIDKAYFEPEATYEISIQSKDAANNDGYSDLKLDNNTLKFVVDRTVPVVSIVGITSDTSYFKDSQDVTVTITDDVLLSRIQIFVNDNVELELESKDFGNYFVDGKFVWSYTVSNEDETNRIAVVCYDAAGNANVDNKDIAEKSMIENFLVTTNRGEVAKFWVINHVVQTAIIGVATFGSAAAVVWFIVYRRKLKLTPKDK